MHLSSWDTDRSWSHARWRKGKKKKVEYIFLLLSLRTAKQNRTIPKHQWSPKSIIVGATSNRLAYHGNAMLSMDDNYIGSQRMLSVLNSQKNFLEFFQSFHLQILWMKNIIRSLELLCILCCLFLFQLYEEIMKIQTSKIILVLKVFFFVSDIDVVKLINIFLNIWYYENLSHW